MLTGLFFTFNIEQHIFQGFTWAYLVENCQRCPPWTKLKLFANKLDMTKYLNVKNLIGTLKAVEITAI